MEGWKDVGWIGKEKEGRGREGGINGPKVPERLTITGAVGHKRTSLWHRRITRNLMHDYRVYEVGRCHGGLTECSKLVFLFGHHFVLSLFPT